MFGTINNDSIDGVKWINFVNKNILEFTFSKFKWKHSLDNNMRFTHLFVRNEKNDSNKNIKSFMYIDPATPSIKIKKIKKVQEYIIDWKIEKYYYLLESNMKLFSNLVINCNKEN